MNGVCPACGSEFDLNSYVQCRIQLVEELVKLKHINSDLYSDLLTEQRKLKIAVETLKYYCTLAEGLDCLAREALKAIRGEE